MSALAYLNGVSLLTSHLTAGIHSAHLVYRVQKSRKILNNISIKLNSNSFEKHLFNQMSEVTDEHTISITFLTKFIFNWNIH